MSLDILGQFTDTLNGILGQVGSTGSTALNTAAENPELTGAVATAATGDPTWYALGQTAGETRDRSVTGTGESTGTGGSSTTTTTSTSTGTSKTMVWLGVGAGTFVIIGIGLYAMSGNQGHAEEN